jgi:hypothetical protein
MIEQLKIIRRIWGSLDRWFVLIVLAYSLGMNVYWTRHLQSETAAAAPVWEVGIQAPSLEAQDLGGARTTIHWAVDGRSSFVYVFSPSCVWCARNLQNMKAIVTNDVLKARYRFIGISLSSDGLEDYVKDKNLPFAVYTIAPGEKFSADGTPETLIISPDSKVTEVWRGAYTPKVQKDIEMKLGVQLPGLDMLAAGTLSIP